MLSFWLPLQCVICGNPPRQLCEDCLGQIPLRARMVYRLGAPSGLACADYSGSVATLVKAYKNDGSVILARYLGMQLAQVLADWAKQIRTDRPLEIALVPAPSRASSNRTRGYSPARLLASNTAAQMRAFGVNATVCDVLRVTGPVRDQGDLNGQQRRSNLVGRMQAVPAANSVIGNRRIVLLDDIVTTGATLAEMNRCLSSWGLFAESFAAFAETL